MKLSIFSLLILFCAHLLVAQNKVHTTDFSNECYDSYGSQNLQRMDENHFMLLSYPNTKEIRIVKCDRQLKELFEIKINRQKSNAKVRCEYIKKSNRIIVTILLSDFVRSFVYDGDTGKELIRKDIDDYKGEKVYVKFCKNRNYLLVYPQSSKSTVEEKFESTIYDCCTLTRLGQIEKPTNTRNSTSMISILINITNQGDIILCKELWDHLEFVFYDKTGAFITSQKHNYEGSYYDYLYREKSAGIAQIILRHKNPVERIEAWSIDYINHTTEHNFSFQLDRNFLKKKLSKHMYGKMSDKPTLKPYKQGNVRQPNYFAAKLSFVDALYDVYGNIFIVLQNAGSSTQTKTGSVMSFSQYFSNEMVILCLDPQGQLRWSVLVDKVANARYDCPYRPNITGVTPIVEMGDSSIQVVNCEQKGWISTNHVAYRRFCLETGKMVEARPLVNEKGVALSIFYFDWLSSNMFAFINMKDVFSQYSKGKMSLQVVEFDKSY
ncbi:MAG: hypothetical protein JEZ14_24250 [Marinilabiliaceae bacterium]|nr:hypothetical protein [Marinilabiliaceae bacterium]